MAATKTADRAKARAAISQRRDPVTASVVICAFTMSRWDLLVEAVDSVSLQSRPALETIVVIDHNAGLFARAESTLPDAIVVANESVRGLSGSRNTGVALARGGVVAFLDDDAKASSDWLAELLAAYESTDVVGAGGWVEPRWRSGEACEWMPDEFLWTVGCSYRGLPTRVDRIRNPIGANMSFRRDAVIRAGGFRLGVGRLDETPLGCEETELAVRVARVVPGGHILQMPAARVEHLVEPERACRHYFWSRCWSEGLSKAIVSRHVGRTDGLASERSYVLRTLPAGVLRGLRDAAAGDIAGAERAAAIMAGLVITTAGYLVGKLRRLSGEHLGVEA